MNGRSRSRLVSYALCLAFFWSEGCVHHIHVTPSPVRTAERPIAESVEVVVRFLALEGADHMPGIVSLEWKVNDLESAIIDYVQRRRTFTSVSDGPSQYRLTVRAWLTMRSRSTYVYKLRLESDLGPTGKPSIKSYVTEKEADGSTIRWVTASDQAPIEQTVQAALDDLLQQIESDAGLYR